MKVYNKVLDKNIDLNLILKTYKMAITIEEIININNVHNRFYHNFNHVKEMLENLSVYDESLIIAILFHDIIYDVTSNSNEEDSAIFFRSKCEFENEKFINTIEKLILCTSFKSEPEDKLQAEICKLDRNILYSNDIGKLLKWDDEVFKEYQCYSISKYRQGRIKFLQEAFKETKNESLLTLVRIIEAKKYKIGFYPGSFNPFHAGHYNILIKAENVFDKVVIGIGKNYEKLGNESLEIPSKIKNRQIIEYSGLIISELEQLKEQGEVYIVRGLRNEYDLHYEENLRNVIKDFIPEQHMIYFFCDKEYEHISSSLIRDIINRKDKTGEQFIKKYCLS